MPRKSAAAAPPPPSPADDVANEPDLADFLKQLVNVDDVGVGDAGGDRFLHPRGAANADAVWSDLDNLDVADPIYMSLGTGGGALGALAAADHVRERVVDSPSPASVAGANGRGERDTRKEVAENRRDSNSPASVGGEPTGSGGRGGSGGPGSSAASAVKTFEHLGETLRVLSDQLRAARRPHESVPEVGGADRTAEATQRRLASTLDDISERLDVGSLVQLFVPKLQSRTGGALVMLQTFKAFTRVKTVHREKFWKYHRMSEGFFFNLSPGGDSNLLGLPGRCFLHSRPEWTPSVCCYQPTEYPRLGCAIDCQMHSTIALPVYFDDPRVRPAMPFAVMELLLDQQVTDMGRVFDTCVGALRGNGLYTAGTDRLGTEDTMRAALGSKLSRVGEGNDVALENMCHALGFPLAQCWIPNDDGLLIAAGAPYCVKDAMAFPFRQISSQISLLGGQGPVGQAYEQGTMIWVDDVQNGSQVDWPLQHATALLGLHGTCTCKIVLHQKHPRGGGGGAAGEPIEAVLEVILPSNLLIAEQQRRSVDALWNYLQNSTELRLVTGGASAATRAASQAQAARGGGAKATANANAARGGAELNSRSSDLTAAVGGDGDGAGGRAHGGNLLAGIPLPGDANAEENVPTWGVTLEILQQHFSKHLKQAAKDLGVGSTTLKRICRRYGITRWPRRSLKSKQGKLQQALKSLYTADGAAAPGERSQGGGDSSAHGGGGASAMSLGTRDSFMTDPASGGDGANDASVHGPNGGVGWGLGGSLPPGGLSPLTRHDSITSSPLSGRAPWPPVGGIAGGSTLSGLKRALAADQNPWGGGDGGMPRPGNAGGWPGGDGGGIGKFQRGFSWHGGDVARRALHNQAAETETREERTLHGEYAFAQFGGGNANGRAWYPDQGASARPSPALPIPGASHAAQPTNEDFMWNSFDSGTTLASTQGGSVHGGSLHGGSVHGGSLHGNMGAVAALNAANATHFAAASPPPPSDIDPGNFLMQSGPGSPAGRPGGALKDAADADADARTGTGTATGPSGGTKTSGDGSGSSFDADSSGKTSSGLLSSGRGRGGGAAGAAGPGPGVVFKASRDDGDGGGLLRVRLLGDVTHAALVDRLALCLRPLESERGFFKIKYQDDEDEWCLLSKDSDLEEAIAFAKQRRENAAAAGVATADLATALGHVRLKIESGAVGSPALASPTASAWGARDVGPPGTPSAARACGASDATFTAKISLGDGDTMRVKLLPSMSFRDLAARVMEASGDAARRVLHFFTLVPIRPRSRGERRSLRTFPVVTLHPRFPFNV